MGKGEQTREVIIERAARLFNEQGYLGASLADIMRATGLEKGGIYNHFGSKEQLALEAFDYSIELVNQRLRAAVRSNPNTLDRLIAMVESFGKSAYEPALPGGCPILNTIIKAGDSQPALRARAEAALERFFDSLRYTMRLGIERGEMRPDAEIQKLASLIVSSLEGGIMVSQVYNDPTHMFSVIEYLKSHLERSLRP